MKRPLEVIVVGSGLAGMAYATQLVDLIGERLVRIRVLAKTSVRQSNSYLAQGGIAAVMRSDDSIDRHVRDTLEVGEGRNDIDVVRLVVSGGPALINGLLRIGADLDVDVDGRLDLAREGGHSMARVVHHRDRTGEELIRVLQQRMRSTSAVEVFEQQRAIDLLVEEHDGARRCIGVRSMDMRRGHLVDRTADLVVLATGGAGQVFRHTTNPLGATGDGMAMARRADVPLRDMAFVQFHPTALYMEGPGPAFLVSEAVRGAGARLMGRDGTPLMKGIHPLGDLAPRNIVARAIHREMVDHDMPHVWLDASPIGTVQFARAFPGIEKECRKRGIVPGRDLIPVMPAAHYMCGGIRTDDRGLTDLAGLLALGECASSGLHGADRLASNSLLEALVMAKRAAESTAVYGHRLALPGEHVVSFDRLSERAGPEVVKFTEVLRRAMFTCMGIIRHHESMLHALRIISRFERTVERSWARKRWSRELIDLRDLLSVARCISEAALAEPFSIGTHFTSTKEAEAIDSVLAK